MFQNINSITYINGQQGIYDSKVKNNSVRYARNAINNYQQAYSIDTFEKYNQEAQEAHSKIQEIKAKSKSIEAVQEYIDAMDKLLNCTPEAEFNLRYAQNKKGEADKMAVMGAAYEELGKRTTVSVDELTKTLQEAINDEFKSDYSADSLDLNQDGQVDLAEYGASILAEDMLSTDPTQLKSENITGVITNEGQNSLLSLAAVNNYAYAQNAYKAICSNFKLDEAQSTFLKDKNNLI
ncbi:hypothetical protein II906_10580 [bacterium]|nr:hypothetical protein [bacterium]